MHNIDIQLHALKMTKQIYLYEIVQLLVATNCIQKAETILVKSMCEIFLCENFYVRFLCGIFQSILRRYVIN